MTNRQSSRQKAFPAGRCKALGVISFVMPKDVPKADDYQPAKDWPWKILEAASCYVLFRESELDSNVRFADLTQIRGKICHKINKLPHIYAGCGVVGGLAVLAIGQRPLNGVQSIQINMQAAP